MQVIRQDINEIQESVKGRKRRHLGQAGQIFMSDEPNSCTWGARAALLCPPVEPAQPVPPTRDAATGTNCWLGTAVHQGLGILGVS